MTTEGLKSCPFCSEEAKIKLAKKYYVGITIWCECEKCHKQSREHGYKILNREGKR